MAREDLALDSLIWRLAAASGEEPADVEAAIETLITDGWSMERIWKLLEAAIDERQGIVETCARALDQPRFAGRPALSQHDRFERHMRKRNKRRKRSK